MINDERYHCEGSQQGIEERLTGKKRGSYLSDFHLREHYKKTYFHPTLRACFGGLGMGLGICIFKKLWPRTRICRFKDTKGLAAWAPASRRCMPAFLYCSDLSWTAMGSQNTHLKRGKSSFFHRCLVPC